MAKIRIHELAKELDKSSKDILGYLQEKGIEAKSASSSVEDAVADTVRKAFTKAEKPAAVTEKIKTKEDVQPVKEENKQISTEKPAKADTVENTAPAQGDKGAVPKKK